MGSWFAASLYKAIGVAEDGYAEWVQPLGASDTYNIDDIVSYNGTPYQSTIDDNVWLPESHPDGWTPMSLSWLTPKRY